MPRKPHPKKEVEAALRYAELKGWRIDVGGGHAWGKMYLPTQEQAMPLWRILHHQYLEYAKESCESQQTDSACGRPVFHHSIVGF